MPFKVEPSLLIDVFKPYAIASSLPLNHLATIAACPTPMDSPPKLKAVRSKANTQRQVCRQS